MRTRATPPLFALLAVLLLGAAPGLRAGEESPEWPLGPIGGIMKLWTDENFVRVSEITPGGPGDLAGLRANDFIYGAFGRDFDPLGGNFEGVVRQLGNAIEHAESTDGQLPLRVLRPGTGNTTVTISLPVLGSLGPAYPVTSAKYADTYEYACAQLHTRIQDDANGDVGYPTGFVGLALLGHPNWADTAGPKPYRLSIDKIRDYFITRVNEAVYSPVEDLLLDHPTDPSDNPNYVPNAVGLETWTLGQAVMFLAEYRTKTGDTGVDADLQLGAELMANRVQYWKQPAKHSNGYSPEYERIRGMTSHGGVTGDYVHLGWGGGINMTGVHLFGGLALAKRAGVDMGVRPRDGHLFGFDLDPGDPIPSSIAAALPTNMILPRGSEDTRTLPVINNVTNAPFTTITDPWYYDLSLDQKFWMKWDFLYQASGSDGHVNYARGTGGTGDAGGRTPGALFGLLAYLGGAPLHPIDQEKVDQMKNYISVQHDRHLNAHAYNMGGGLFTALVLPWLDDRQQRYFLDNWKFYVNFMRQPDGSLRYFQGRNYSDAYQNFDLVALVNNALPRSIARGGLPHVPAFDPSRVFIRFRQPLLEWPGPDARFRRVTGNSENFIAELLDSDGNIIPPARINATWSVVSGPATSGIFSNANALATTATFPQAGLYTLRLTATDTGSGLAATEDILVEVPPPDEAGYIAGQAEYKVYTGISGVGVADLTSAPAYPDSPASTATLTRLEGTHSGDNYGATLTTVIRAPETGAYRFYIASDDRSSLRFNPGGTDPAGAVEIASVSGWTGQHEWDKFSTQQSADITLTAGERYYLQALHKEGNGGDNLAVGWTTPSDPAIRVIASPYLSLPQTDGGPVSPAILTHPQDITADLGDTVDFAIATEGGDPAIYQWRLNGEDFGLPQFDPALTLTNVGAGLAGVWDCIFTTADTVLVSQPATLTIDGIGLLATGGLWQEVFTDIDGSSIDDLLDDPSYPHFSTSSGVLAETATPTLGNRYGQRWSGWLVPPASGRYRFYLASDDASRLYLSTDATESNKQLIRSLNGFTGEKQWSARSPSDWYQLEAGQRYYVEFLHKEGTGGDHAAFTWQREGDPAPTNGVGAIPAANLHHITGGTDGDDIDNGWEITHFDDLQTADETTNADGDPMTDFEESIAGTDPNDNANYLGILNLTLQPGSVTFDIVTGAVPCEVWYSPDLSPDSWIVITSGHTTGPFTDTDPDRMNASRGFYRLVIP